MAAVRRRIRAAPATALRLRAVRPSLIVITIALAPTEMRTPILATVSFAVISLLNACTTGERTAPVATNVPPSATITAPSAGSTFRAGEAMVYSGSGTDTEEGAIPPARMSWWIDLHHDDHTHVFLPKTSGSASGTLPIPTEGETSANIWYRVHLEVRDDSGATTEATRDVQPQKATMRFATSPAGLQITVDGQSIIAPQDVIGVTGIRRTIGVASPQTLGGSQYVFTGWSDGGASTHAISTPAANTTYTANFALVPPNQAPTVSLSAPAAGSSLTQNVAVTVRATAADADGTVTQVQFFDGTTSIGTDNSSPYEISWTPTALGSHSLTARATDDDLVVTASAAVVVTIVAPAQNTSPVATITAPAAGATFRAGDVISYSGSGTDAQDGAIPPARMTWWADLHHDAHTHPFVPRTSGSAGGTVTLPTQGETSSNIWYRFYLEVRDDSGATHTVSREIQPLKSTMRFVTSPAGLQVTIDGQPQTAPVDIVGVVGHQRTIGATSPQTLGSTQYTFVSWSDGGAASHGIATPATNTTYTATFAPVAPVNQPPTVSITAPTAGSTLTVNVAAPVRATATDSDGTVAQVEFFDGATSIGIDASSPFEISWTPTTTGSHSLTARATDDDLATTTSAAIAVTVQNASSGDVIAPTVQLTSPGDSVTGLNGAIVMQATAADNVGVAGVTFQVDGETIGSEDTTAPYSVTLPATSVYTSGQHVIRARARDAAGNLSAWDVATVTFGGSVTVPQGFTMSSYVTGLDPATTMAFSPDGRLFIAEQDGSVRVVKNGALLATPFATLPVQNYWEQGLLGIAFDPSFAANQYVYVYYTARTPTVHNRVSRLTANGDVMVAGSEVVVLDLPAGGQGNHNGGALHFGPDGMLYIAVGDHGEPTNSPSLTSPHGKMLRLNSNGSIPTDNPFYGQTTGINRAIWARGLRNPFTFGFQPGTGRMFINDVGQEAWEEINDGIAGSNYGWPATEGYTTNSAYRSPLFAYPHGGNFVQGVSIVGAAFYNPATIRFPAAYVGDYFFADYMERWVSRMDTDNGNAVYAFARIPGLTVDVRVGPDGAVYVLGDTGTWGVMRISRP